MNERRALNQLNDAWNGSPAAFTMLHLDADDVIDALVRLRPHGDLLSAAVHLALPWNSLIGFNAHTDVDDDGNLSLTADGRTVTFDGFDLAENIDKLAAFTSTLEGPFLDLGTLESLHGAIRVARNGDSWVTHGLRELLGMNPLCIPCWLPVTDVYAVLSELDRSRASWQEQGVCITVAAQHPDGPKTLFVSVSHGGVTSAVDESPLVGKAADIEALRVAIGVEFDCERVDVFLHSTDTEYADLIAVFGTHRVCLPITMVGRGTSIGLPLAVIDTHADAADDLAVPQGFDVAGVCRREGTAYVAVRHQATGYVGYLAA
ncbi:MAG: hypothetical protein GY882_11630 [Actinomycetia bacterium]|nr:hypothetical protein [Actinomycetes bacterium]